MAESSPTHPSAPLAKGIVKTVISGDTLVVRGIPKGGPPPEKTISIAGITTPRIGRRPGDIEHEVKDEPYGWEARELLRSKVIGKEVMFSVDYKVNTGREFVRLYLPSESDPSQPGENLAETLISEGLAEARVKNQPDEWTSHLDALMQNAKTSKKGRWSDDANEKHIRNITWTYDNPRMLVDSLKHQPQKAVIEHVRDGTTVRAFLLPDFQYVTIMLSGVKSPSMGANATAEPEPFAEEAKYYTESRLLQRDVQIILEGVSNQNFLGTVLHPNGNIAELLLKEGLAKCVDWSIALVTGGPEHYRSLERAAREKRIRLWKSYIPPTPNSMTASTFTARVVEIGMGDSMMVVREDQNANEATPMRIYLSSIRQPRDVVEKDAKDGGGESKAPLGRAFRPLYDIPYMFEAREFLRKRLIGKKVNVTVDYIQPASDNYPEKTCCTVEIGGQNLSEALVSRGLSTVARHRQDDDKRARDYDTLLSAEAKAEKDKLRIHAIRAGVALDKPATVRVQDLQGDVNKAKQFFPYLQRAGRSDAVVEHVQAGGRVRVFVPKETVLATLLLGGISCPRGARTMAVDGKAPQAVAAEPYGEEAMHMTKSLCLQHDVQVEVESTDRAGNMLGWLFLSDGTNLAEKLVRSGLATVHGSAERSRYATALYKAEEEAKAARRNIWSNYVEPTVDETAAALQSGGTISDRLPAYKRVVVTECMATEDRHLRLSVQHVDDGARIEQLMGDLRSTFATTPPVRGAYQPRKGDLCAAKFDDGEWYRARVETVRAGGQGVDVLYIDYGNRAHITDVVARVAALPTQIAGSAPGAREYLLAFVMLSQDADWAQGSIEELQKLCAGNDSDVSMNVEYRNGGIEYATLMNTDKIATTLTTDAVDFSEHGDIGRALIERGVALAEFVRRNDPRLKDLVTAYQNAQVKAKRERLAMWRYGDFTGTDL